MTNETPQENQPFLGKSSIIMVFGLFNIIALAFFFYVG